MSPSIVTIDQLDLEISLAHIAVGGARAASDRCPSAENQQRVDDAVAEVDRLLDQRLAALASDLQPIVFWPSMVSRMMSAWPGVLRGLGDDVQEHPPRRPCRARREPRRLGQRLLGVEVGQRLDQLVGARGHLLVLGEDAGQRLVRGAAGAVGCSAPSVLGSSRWPIASGPPSTKSAQPPPSRRRA